MGYPFNNLPFGQDGEFITTVIEIPQGSMLKAEWRRKQGFFALDRVEPGIFAKPVNYGFIPQTLDEDGDELDVLLVTGEPLPMGLVVEECRVIGMLDFEDDGENDHKIIVVPADDRNAGPSPTSTSSVRFGRSRSSTTSCITKTSKRAAPSCAASSAPKKLGRSFASVQSVPKPTNGGNTHLTLSHHI